MNVHFPYQFDQRRRTAEAGPAHLRQLIEQVLFTSPGERVNRPEFGSGLLRLLFAPNSLELAATTQFLVQGSLQQFLGDLIQVEAVELETSDASVRVSVKYVDRRTQSHHLETFSHGDERP